ncbi:MRG/MORF4L-binding protein-like [Rhipicephalus sanguineus]|uniref:MRG/MORF4L-binding protein-like n=1 Tax=Rhipicephalus sanguineus TaxID=34632 RepID=UPI0020C42254|nr:MRG/MORF4L-binding protein-like [Rhipicephalus sanguineus]
MDSASENPSQTLEKPLETSEKPLETSEKPPGTSEKPSQTLEKPSKALENPLETLEKQSGTSANPSHTLDWNVDTEVTLFRAMKGHKPIGVNRYFQMACIVEKFSVAMNKDISSQAIWDHFDDMYDMEALHESEILPFPNNETEFSLPESEFGDLMAKYRKDEEPSEQAPLPAASSSGDGKELKDDSSASKKPRASSAKKGKGNGKAAKSSAKSSTSKKVKQRSEGKTTARQDHVFLE